LPHFLCLARREEEGLGVHKRQPSNAANAKNGGNSKGGVDFAPLRRCDSLCDGHHRRSLRLAGKQNRHRAGLGIYEMGSRSRGGRWQSQPGRVWAQFSFHTLEDRTPERSEAPRVRRFLCRLFSDLRPASVGIDLPCDGSYPNQLFDRLMKRTLQTLFGILAMTAVADAAVLKEGQPFPATVFPDLDGQPRSTVDFHGKKTILHVFASW